MNKINIFIVTALMTLCLLLPGRGLAQSSNRHDAARYRTMSREGVWSVGLGIEPVVGLTHPISDGFAGGRYGCAGSFGVRLEGGYFVVDNMRLSATVGYVGNGWSGALRWNIHDAWCSLSQLKLSLGAHWHEGRWDFGGGLVWGRSNFAYNAANTAEGGTNDERFGAESFRDRRTLLGLSYEASYMLTPFLRVGGSYEPMVALGGGYAHSFGLRMVIYLPFTDAVVCK